MDTWLIATTTIKELILLADALDGAVAERNWLKMKHLIYSFRANLEEALKAAKRRDLPTDPQLPKDDDVEKSG